MEFVDGKWRQGKYVRLAERQVWISWQIVPKRLIELMNDSDPEKAQKVMEAMMKMQKIIIADLEKAYYD